MSDETQAALLDWSDRVAAALEVDRALDADTVGAILGLAGRAAHGVVRPAAPLTTFLAGLAMGADPDLDLAEVTARVTALLPQEP